MLFRVLARGDVEGDSGHADGRSIGTVDGLPADMDPAQVTGRRDDPVLDIVIDVLLDGSAHLRFHPFAVAGMDRGAHLAVAERLIGIPAEIRPEVVGRLQRHRDEIEAP